MNKNHAKRSKENLIYAADMKEPNGNTKTGDNLHHASKISSAISGIYYKVHYSCGR